METLEKNARAANEAIRETANRPPFIRHEMDELVQRLASSGDQELITLGKNLEQYNNTSVKQDQEFKPVDSGP